MQANCPRLCIFRSVSTDGLLPQVWEVISNKEAIPIRYISNFQELFGQLLFFRNSGSKRGRLVELSSLFGLHWYISGFPKREVFPQRHPHKRSMIHYLLFHLSNNTWKDKATIRWMDQVWLILHSLYFTIPSNCNSSELKHGMAIGWRSRFVFWWDEFVGRGNPWLPVGSR